MKTYIVRFDRIGRAHTPEPFVVTVKDSMAGPGVAEALSKAIYRHARKYLMSRNYTVFVDLDSMRGSIEYGRYGDFTVAEETT